MSDQDFSKEIALRREELIREIKIGLEQADRGELVEADEVFAELRRMRKTMAIGGA